LEWMHRLEARALHQIARIWRSLPKW
jgi:hypothetical protein